MISYIYVYATHYKIKLIYGLSTCVTLHFYTISVRAVLSAKTVKDFAPLST